MIKMKRGATELPIITLQRKMNVRRRCGVLQQSQLPTTAPDSGAVVGRGPESSSQSTLNPKA